MKPVTVQHLIFLVLLIITLPATAQHSLTVATGTYLKVEGGTSLYVDGLVLKPAASYDITGANSFSRTATASPAPPVTYIQRVYQLLTSLPAFSGDITIYYQDSELGGLTESSLNLKLYNGAAWMHYNASTRDAANNFVTTAGLNNVIFSQATLGSPGAALPVTITRFWETVDNCKALLQWTTASEQNSKHFEVQHSADGLIYTTLGIVPASGNSTTEKKYSYNYNLSNTTNYFRLVMVDINGSSKLSAIITVRNNCLNEIITVHPNPVRNVVTVSGLTGKNSIVIIDAIGRRVAVSQTANATEQLNLSMLSPGNYTMQVLKDGTILQSVKLIKQ